MIKKSKLLALLCIFVFQNATATEKFIEIQKSIFEENFKIAHDEYKNELNKLNDQAQFKENNDFENLEKGKKIHLNTYKSILKNIIENSLSNLVVAQANFRFSLIELEENKLSLAKAKKYLLNGLSQLKNPNESIDLYIKMNCFAGNLFALNEEYEKSNSYYEKVLKFIEKNNLKNRYPQELIRSFIGKGDDFYFMANFSDAYKNYKNAKRNIDIFSQIEQKLKTQYESWIAFRLILSSYRDAQYDNVLNELKMYAHKASIYDEFLTQPLLEGFIKIGGIALFELKNEDYFEKIAQDQLYGEFGKKIILNSFDRFFELGELKLVNTVAQNIKKYFYKSELYPEFLKALAIGNIQNEDREEYQHFNYLAATEISKNSFWWKTVPLSKDYETYRQNIVNKYAQIAEKYYAKKVMTYNFKSDALKLAKILESLIAENDIYKQKGILYQQVADALYRAGDLNTAMENVEKSLKTKLDEEYLKSALFLRLKIMRDLSSNSKNTSDSNFKLYEIAVDEYINSFPHELQGQNGLFECAKRSELLGDLDNAKNRYVHLLGLISNSQNFNNDIKSRIVLNLSSVLQKLKNVTKSTADLCSEVEKLAKKNKLNKNSIDSIEKANSNLAYKINQQIQNKGELAQAAEFLVEWAQQNINNLQSYKMFNLALEQFAQLQNWNRVYELGKSFIEKNNLKDNLNIVTYWTGKAAQNLCLFEESARLFKTAVELKGTMLSPELKLNSINHAILVYENLKQVENLSNSLNLKSEIIKLKNSKDNIKSKNIIEINQLMVAGNWNNSKINKLDSLFLKELNIKNKELLPVFNVLNNFDNQEFLKQEKKFNIDPSDILNSKMIDIKNRIEKRVISFQLIFPNDYLDNYQDNLRNLSSLNMNIYKNYILLSKLDKNNIKIIQKAEQFNAAAKNYQSKSELLSNNNEVNLRKIQFSSLKDWGQLHSRQWVDPEFFEENKEDINNPTIDKEVENNAIFINQNIQELNLGHTKLVIQNLNEYLNNRFLKFGMITKDLQFSPVFRNVQLLLALAYYEAQDEDHAWPILNNLMLWNQTWEPIYLTLSEIYHKKNAFDLALMVSTKGIDKIENPSVYLFMNQARAQIDLQDYINAQQTLASTLNLFPNNPEIIGLQALIDYKTNKIIPACEKFESSYNLNQNSLFLAYQHATCSIQSKNYDETAKVIKLALTQNPNSPEFYYLLGLMFSEQEKYSDAQHYWENFLKFSNANDARRIFVKNELMTFDRNH